MLNFNLIDKSNHKITIKLRKFQFYFKQIKKPTILTIIEPIYFKIEDKEIFN